MLREKNGAHRAQEVAIPIDGVTLAGDLVVPADATAVVLFAHGSGSSRFSVRNRAVAGALQRAGFATLLLDLLTPSEERFDALTGHLRFDVRLLATRLEAATQWLKAASAPTHGLPIGYFGASTGAAAALIAAAEHRGEVKAVVSRGGRPDLAADTLARVRAPTLLIVGSRDVPVIPLNQDAFRRLHCEKELRIIPGATHLFEEPGTLDQVTAAARDWFLQHLTGATVPSAETSGW
jgi:alpha-beta hydrolase superfamily lysophospholipase